MNRYRIVNLLNINDKYNIIQRIGIIVPKIRKAVSNAGIFLFICAFVACLVTAAWWIYPFCLKADILIMRWIIGIIVAALLFITGIINVD